MNIAVAGGTGFIGRHVTAALARAGHRVVVLTRDPARASVGAEVEARRADVTDPGSLAGTLDGCEAVVGAVQFPNYPAEVPRRGLTFDAYDRRGTENLIAEARRAGVGRFVYVSGAGADPGSDRTWYRAKGLAEAAVIASGLRYAIVRPSWAYGPEDRALNRFALIARWSPVVPRIGMRPQRIRPVHVDDVAAAIARVFEVEDAWDRVFEIGGPEILTMDEVIRTLLAVMGRRRLVVPVPAVALKLATAPLTLLPRPPMTPGGIDFAVQDGLVDTTATERILGVRPVSLADGLRRYLAPA